MKRKTSILTVAALVSALTLVGCDGQEIWRNTFNGDGNKEDVSTAMTMDAAGNSYITGYVHKPIDGSSIGWGEEDLVVIKINDAGQTVWSNTYDGPYTSADLFSFADDRGHAIALDGSGNVIVAGNSHGQDPTGGMDYGEDFLVVKYSPAGEELWSYRFNGPTTNRGGYDSAQALTIDAQGNIYATGKSDMIDTDRGRLKTIITVKLSPTGELLWKRELNDDGYNNNTSGESIALDSNGDVLVAGYDYGKAILFKLSPAGETLWKYVYDAEEMGYDQFKKIVLDGNDDVYLTGYGATERPQYDMLAMKVNGTTGALIWKTIDGDSSYDHGTDLAVDNSGALYVIGMRSKSEGSSKTRNDSIVRKYDANGNPVWSKIYEAASNAEDRPVSIQLGSDGNVYALSSAILWLGSSVETGRNSTIKVYNPNGQELFSETVNGLLATDGIVNASGVYTFTSTEKTTDKKDIVTARYAAN